MCHNLFETCEIVERNRKAILRFTADYVNPVQSYSLQLWLAAYFDGSSHFEQGLRGDFQSAPLFFFCKHPKKENILFSI